MVMGSGASSGGAVLLLALLAALVAVGNCYSCPDSCTGNCRCASTKPPGGLSPDQVGGAQGRRAAVCLGGAACALKLALQLRPQHASLPCCRSPRWLSSPTTTLSVPCRPSSCGR